VGTQCTVGRDSEFYVVRKRDGVFIVWVEIDLCLCVHSVL